MQAMVHKSLINIMVFVDEMLWSSKTWVFSRRQLTLFLPSFDWKQTEEND